MQYILTSIKIVCITVCAALLQGCSEEGIIPRKEMVSIVKEMYLADQYIERTPDIQAQTDSLTVYPAILALYGYTVDDYSNSLRHYLQKDDSYNRILLQAQRELERTVEELDDRIRRELELKIRAEGGVPKAALWWAIDSVRAVPARELVYDPLLRSVRWLVLPDERLVKWSMQDSAVVDIPGNPYWWGATLGVEKRSFNEFYLRK